MEQLNFLKSSRYSQPLRCEKFLNEIEPGHPVASFV